MHTNDDSLFDRLADGELSADERRRLLTSLDDRPGGWRQCALAFLEAQAWRQQCSQVVQEGSAEDQAARRAADQPSAPRQGVGRLALAASLLVAFTLGLALRESVLPFRSPAPNPVTEIATVDAPPAGLSQPHGQAGEALTFWVRDESGRSMPVRVPLVDAGTLDRQLGLEFQSALPPDVRDRLKDNGYDVQSKRRYAPFWLDDGRSMVVPVEDTRVVPVSQTVY